jgi:hypothetical protein
MARLPSANYARLFRERGRPGRKRAGRPRSQYEAYPSIHA